VDQDWIGGYHLVFWVERFHDHAVLGPIRILPVARMNESQAIKDQINRLWQEAELYESQGLYDHAVEKIQRVLSNEPGSRKAQAKIVQLQFAKRMLDSSASQPVMAPREKMAPRVSIDLGLAYMGMSLFGEALEEFLKAFESSPEVRTELVPHITSCMVQLERYGEAREVIAHVIRDKGLDPSVKAGMIWETVSVCMEKNAFREAYHLLDMVPLDLREFIGDFDRIFAELAESRGLAGSLGVKDEYSEDGGLVPIAASAEAALGGDFMARADEATAAETGLEFSIPLKTEVRYSKDNENWNSGTSSHLSADWALLDVPESMTVGDALVLQILLPSDSAYDSVWIISKVTEVDVEKNDRSGSLVRAGFDSFLPGGEVILKSFIDKVVQDPSILATEHRFTDRATFKQPQVVFDSEEEQAIKKLEAELVGGNLVDAPGLVSMKEGSAGERPDSGAGPQAVERKRDKTVQKIPAHDVIVFACMCGEPHSVRKESAGRMGKCRKCGRLVKIPYADGQTDRVTVEVVGKTVGGCRILHKIGGGGMGGVFKAHHIALDIPVAVKILHSHLADRDPVFIKRFIREARATAKLQHPHIVGVMNVGHERQYHFLVMPYVGGGSAAAILARSGRFSLERVLDTGIQMAHALTLAEECNILHRDIKPANILFTEKGEAKLSDLGLARSYDTPDAAITQTGIACGTPLYFSPEQAKGSADLDTRSDIYSLGITLYHLLNGSPPFTGESAYVIFQKHVYEHLPPLEHQTPPLPDSVFRLLAKMTEKKREDRFANAQEMLDALEALKDEIVGSRKSPSRQGILQRLGIKRSD